MHPFFLSYSAANEHDGQLIRDFFNKLQDRITEIKGRGSANTRGFIDPPFGTGNQTAAFFDRETLEHGAEWEPAISQALDRSCVFVPLLSPSLFRSKYCGREWEYFSPREQAGRPILPIVWEDPKRVLGQSSRVSALNFSQQNYPPLYENRGLKWLLEAEDPESRRAVREFVNALAENIVAKTVLLGEPETPGNFMQSANAFDDVEETRLQRPIRSSPGRFVYLSITAASQDEIKSLPKRSVSFYGDSGWDWQPFSETRPPALAHSIYRAIVDKNCLPRDVSPEASLTETLKKALEQKWIVLLVLDNWTLGLPKYEGEAANADHATRAEASLIYFIVRNEGDADFASQKENLDRWASNALSSATVNGRTRFINSEEALSQAIKEFVERRKITDLNTAPPRAATNPGIFAAIPRVG